MPVDSRQDGRDIINLVTPPPMPRIGFRNDANHPIILDSSDEGEGSSHLGVAHRPKRSVSSNSCRKTTPETFNKIGVRSSPKAMIVGQSPKQPSPVPKSLTYGAIPPDIAGSPLRPSKSDTDGASVPKKEEEDLPADDKPPPEREALTATQISAREVKLRQGETDLKTQQDLYNRQNVRRERKRTDFRRERDRLTHAIQDGEAKLSKAEARLEVPTTDLPTARKTVLSASHNATDDLQSCPLCFESM